MIRSVELCRTLVAASVVAAVLLAADDAAAQSGSRGGTRVQPQQGSSQRGTAQQGSGNREDQAALAFASKFWTYLQDANYRNWAPAPGQGADFYEGVSPHGAQLKMFLNRRALTAGGNGAIIVKENFTPQQELAAVTVMYRSDGYDPERSDWWYAEFDPDGNILRDENGVPWVGRSQFCIDCHATAAGDDYLFYND